MGVRGIRFVNVGKDRPFHALRRDHGALRRCRQHAVEHVADRRRDFIAETAQILINPQQPITELGEHRRQLRRRRDAFAQILLETAGEFLVLARGDALGLFRAQPIEHRRSIGLQILRRLRMVGIAH